MELRAMVKRWKLKEGSLPMEVLEHPVTLAGVPGKTIVFANAGNCSFCNIDGYQETVFAWIADPGARPRLVPIAFSTEDFIRLLYSTGSPELAARAGQLSQGEYALRRANIGEAPSGVRKLYQNLELSPIENPRKYVQLVQSILDTSLLTPVPAAAAG